MKDHFPTHSPDAKTFERIFQQRTTLIEQCTRQYQRQISQGAIEDIVDRTLLIGIRRYQGSLDNQQNLMGYLSAVCQKEVFHYLKSNKKSAHLPDDVENPKISNPAELHEQREIIKRAIQNIGAISTPDELKLFREQINFALDGKKVSRSSIQEKYGWSSAKLNKMTASLNLKLRIVKAQVLSFPLFLWDLPRKILHGNTSNAEATTVTASTTTAGGATILSMKALPVLLVATTVVGGGTMVYRYDNSTAKKSHVVHQPPVIERSQQFTSSPQISVVDKPTTNKPRFSPKKRHKRRRQHQSHRVSQPSTQSAAVPDASPQNTPSPPSSAPSPKPKPTSPPVSSSKGEGDAEFGVDEP